MWPFNDRKPSVESSGAFEVAHKPLSQLINRDLNDINMAEMQLRLWLPEKAKTAVMEMADHSGDTMTAYLTKFFVAYLYGTHELIRMHETKTGLYYLPPTRIRYSRMGAQNVIPDLGKNLYALKLFVPEKVKTDLQTIADNAGMPLGRFVREILVSYLFGHTFWPERMCSWSEMEEKTADEWELSEK